MMVVMRWCVLVVAMLVVATVAVTKPRRCSGRLARERLKAAEKIRDKRYYLICCSPLCSSPPQRRPRPLPTTRKYQPYHKTWFGLKHGCNCSTVGSESNVCDIRTGQCRCRPHVTGRACDICEEGYWGLQLGGCRRCACGAGTAACDPVNGACACGPGVGGDSCDKCLPGFYGFGANGCLPCPTCTDGKVCSVESGRCVCPAHAHGPGCRLCAAGYTRAQRGCKPCECGPGAVTETCDSQSGQCKCRAGWTGPACDACAAGHWGPRCRPCGCHLPGTLCEKEPCSCDEGGRCPCKENVVGDKCDACLDGTFGLSGLNPAGCTACFCFGRSSHCTQASLSRAALHVAAHAHLTVTYSDERIHVDHDSMITIRTSTLDATISIPLPPVPVYMELDSLFHGDRVTSYGGALRFRVEEEGGRDLDKEVLLNWPLVRIEGPVTIDYYERIPAINSTYAARLHESLWKVPGKSGAASRSVLMLALQNVTRILVRVTTRAPTRIERLHTLLLNVSLDTAIPGLSRSEPALGVERCSCPRGYGAGSCQQPAVGFWMPPQRIRYTSVGGTILIQLEGEVQPCHCNGRAKSCDPVTGDCLNCTHGTGGPQCADCAAGHYGSPASPDGCQPCPCPSRTHNFATACAVTAGRVHCLCAQGYSGLECELCASGYYRASDGVTCASCACDIRGATDERCDHARCRCRPFVTGDRCDRCREPRTFLTDEGCLPCDNCTQTLLDSVEALSADLRIRADINELSRIPKPFPALLEFAHNTTMLQDSFHILLNNKERHKNIERLISNLEEDEHRIFTEANKLSTEAKKYESHAQYLSLESMSGLEEVYKQRASIGELVANLDDFAKGERHVSAHRALKEANHLLKHIKEINLVDFIAGTHDVADSANLQSTSVQEYDYRLSDTYQRLKKLQSTLEAWEMKSDDLVRLADIVWTAGDHVAELEKTVRPRLAGIRDIGLRCRLMLEDITSLSPKNLTSDITTAILQSQALAIKFPEYHAELDALTLAAEEKEGILYTITPTYKQKYLDAVQKHVEELADKAKKYKSLFAGTRLLASKGVAAAHAWSEVAKTVREAETIANEAHNAASDAVAIARGPDPLVETAAEGRVASEELKTRAAKLLKKAEELRSHLEHLRRGADLVSVELRALGWLERALSAPQTQPAPALAHAGTQADRVFAMSRALYDEASGIRRAVTYELRRRLTELRRHGDSALGAAQEHVSQIRGNTVQAAEAAEALNSAAEARAREHTAAAAKLNPSLQALRDKIARARHAANSISVSLTSVPGWAAGCSRAYRVRPASSAVSLVTVAVTFDNHVADGPLLYLVDRSQEQAKYLKLVVNNKRLRLTWDLGGGEGSILHHEVLQPTHDEGDHNTYRIEIERIWNSVHLRLERAGNSLVSVSNSTSPDHVTFRPSRLWLGHRERGEGPGLPGCVHSLQTGGETLGLWHSEVQPPTAKCTGCSMRWYATPGAGDTSLAWFNGAGYAELRRSGRRAADRRQFSVAFTFRTRDQHALLFMTTDTVNNRSITVTLRDCRVVFTVEYAAGRLEIVSGGRHCSGCPVHVQAIRVYQPHRLERGSLRVNGEETLGSPSPAVDSAASLPDLTSAAYCVGGAPPGAAAPAPPLLGALGALTVDRKGYDLRDTPSRFGMELGVVEKPLYSASFEGSGFVELPSPQWRRKAALGLSFRARAPDGLILFRSPGTNNEVDDENDGFYLVIVLVKGSLAVLASAGKGEVRLVSNSTRFDDGALHTIRLVRNHKQLELWSDAERLSTTSLSGGAFPARDRGLYLGGVAHGLAQARPVFPAIGFTGTIADFIVDSELTQLESSVSWSDTGLGRADSDDPAETVLEPSTLQAQPENDFGCVKRSSFTVEAGAVKFGDAAHSHTSLRLAGKGRQLALSLQLRTFASDGLLFLVPGSKLKPKHYLALMVREGKLKLIARGRKRKEVSLAGNVSDGTWRSVTVRISRSRLILSSEGVAATAHMAAISRAQRIYIGGLPQAMPVQVPANVLKAGVFRGCVRRMRVHGRDEDLVRDARSHHAVGQCFPRVEPAAYFGGDAHALWSRGWAHAPGTPLELRLQFRSPEPHGLLLAAADITLELADGAVVLSRHSADLEPSRAEARGASRSFCDNAWHLVIARVGRASLALSVDAGPEIRTERMLVDLGDAAAAEVVTPVYVAGLPEDMINSPDGKENFKGCLRDVIIGGQKKDWASMDTLHNVLLDSCPVSE